MSGGLAGRLRERVAIARRAPGRDALGAANGAWSDLGMAWAAVVPDGLGALVAGEARAALPRWRVTLRTRGLAVGDRLTWGGRTLTIVAIEEDPRTPERIVAVTEQGR